VAVVASFGFLGSNSDMEMFPMNVIAPEYRTALLISSLAAVIIPMLALIALIVRILFNKVMIGRYTGFTLLAIWLVVVGAVIVYGTRTARDFREQSTVMEEVKLESMPAFHLDRKSTRLNSSHVKISYAVFCLKKKTNRV